MAYRPDQTVDISQKPYLRAREVHALYGGSEPFWRKRALAGDIPAYRIGEVNMLFRREDVEAFIKANPVTGPVACRDGRRNGKKPGPPIPKSKS